MKQCKSAFINFLDRTAEKNPFLWLPCVLLLTFFFIIFRLARDIRTAFVRSVRSENIFLTENYSEVILRKTSPVMRVFAVSVAMAFSVMLVPEFGQAMEIGAFAEEISAAGIYEELSSVDIRSEIGSGSGGLSNFNISVGVKSLENLELITRADGVIINSNDLTDITVTALDALSNMSPVRINTDAKSVMLKNIDGDEIAVYIDADNDGTYETRLNQPAADADAAEIEDAAESADTVKGEDAANPAAEDESAAEDAADSRDTASEGDIAPVSQAADINSINNSNSSDESYKEKYYDSGDDVSSAAGAYSGSVPIETAAVPVSDGITVPAVSLPQGMSFSNKKRRYKILRRRKLDDLVFVY